MTSRFESFDESPLGAFIESPLGMRGSMDKITLPHAAERYLSISSHVPASCTDPGTNWAGPYAPLNYFSVGYSSESSPGIDRDISICHAYLFSLSDLGEVPNGITFNFTERDHFLRWQTGSDPTTYDQSGICKAVEWEIKGYLSLPDSNHAYLAANGIVLYTLTSANGMFVWSPDTGDTFDVSLIGNYKWLSILPVYQWPSCMCGHGTFWRTLQAKYDFVASFWKYG